MAGDKRRQPLAVTTARRPYHMKKESGDKAGGRKREEGRKEEEEAEDVKINVHSMKAAYVANMSDMAWRSAA